MRIAFICPYPFDAAPSQRFRFEQYFAALEQKGWRYEQLSFLDNKAWTVLYDKGHVIKKASYLLLAYFRRFTHLFRLFSCDYVFIHREASPLGPPLFEWIIAKILRKKIIYDFDDAIWIPMISEHNKLAAFAKNYTKFFKICKWSYKISAGNAYLAKVASSKNSNAVVNPTTLDTEHYHNRNLYLPPQTNQLIVGWTGTHSTLFYLKAIVPTLNELASVYDFEIRVIANQEPDFSLLKMNFIQWQKTSEIQDLMALDIGLMPLEDDAWSQGKCGFKALQYMALEIPCIASPVGVNSSIISDGVNGFLAKDPIDWKQKLEMLIKDEELRKKLGKEGRKTVENEFSIAANTANFLNLFS